jgi:hypothetical protein
MIAQKREKDAQKVHDSLIAFLVWLDKRKGKVSSKKFTFADMAQQMEEDDEGDDTI